MRNGSYTSSTVSVCSPTLMASAGCLAFAASLASSLFSCRRSRGVKLAVRFVMCRAIAGTSISATSMPAGVAAGSAVGTGVSIELAVQSGLEVDSRVSSVG